MSEEAKCAVGDQLAFWVQNRWVVARVTKITTTGRIYCGQWVLNPDLTVRGGNVYAPIQACRVTPEIKQEVQRYRWVRRLRAVDWEKCSNELLSKLVQLLAGEVL